LYVSQMRKPINETRDATFFHIKGGKLVFMAATKGNPNAMMVFEFLYAMVATFHEYFGELDINAVSRNSSVIYELIDDMLDYGFPQITGADKLKAYIRGDGEKPIVLQRATLTQELTGQNTFRPPDLMYKKNEIYIDVVESINLLMSKEGQKLSEEAVGQILLRTYLSGTPQCKFGFNDSIQLQLREEGGGRKAVAPQKGARKSVAIDDVTCHQCVKLHQFEKTREIQFVPPDGAFELMNYRVTSSLRMPFTVSAIVNEIGGTRVDYRVRLASNYSPTVYGTKVVLKIPTPPNTAQQQVRVKMGKVKYDATENAFLWILKRLPGQQAFDFVASVTLMQTVVKKAWSRPPISMEFEVPEMASGLMVQFLRVVEPKLRYEPTKWVRYISKAGQYLIRIN